MKKVLMILTKDRRDCVDMNLLLHERGGSFEVFDQVVFLLNAVSDRHMRFIDTFIKRHPKLAVDKMIGDGTRPKGISDMQNRCVEKYPDAFYVKTDEDVFVPNGWAQRMVEAYELHRHRPDLALITPLLPNNAYCLNVLLNQFYPELLETHKQLFGCEPSIEPTGLTWRSPAVGEWATRQFIDLEKANQRQRKLVSKKHPAGHTQHVTNNFYTDPHATNRGTSAQAQPASDILDPFHYFSNYFSIGCIGYDYRHWRKMGGIPWNDEPGWCKWIEDHHQVNVLDCRQIALHYTFFVQQEWLDRSTLIEDIRATNLPDTISIADRLHIHRLNRIARQIPAVIKRRWSAA
jgi:hypothetical protein